MSSGLVPVNGTRIYHELRGSGPPLLFVSGATGDAGHFERAADLLAQDFTVITYDRRGNSRSPRPEAWTTTSVEEQAADAAGLLTALDIDAAKVVGNSGGAIITLGLAVLHPARVSGAVLYEPPLLGVLRDPAAVMGMLEPMIQARNVEAFVRFAAGAAFSQIPSAVYARMLGNGETLFGTEMGALESFRPSDETLSANRVPIEVWLGEDSPAFFGEACAWISERLAARIVRMPGGHAPMFERPAAFAESIRGWLGSSR
jgi:pimeloyl-ACP methyl ester carboxylesterase